MSNKTECDDFGCAEFSAEWLNAFSSARISVAHLKRRTIRITFQSGNLTYTPFLNLDFAFCYLQNSILDENYLLRLVLGVWITFFFWWWKEHGFMWQFHRKMLFENGEKTSEKSKKKNLELISCSMRTLLLELWLQWFKKHFREKTTSACIVAQSSHTHIPYGVIHCVRWFYTVLNGNAKHSAWIRLVSHDLALLSRCHRKS